MAEKKEPETVDLVWSKRPQRYVTIQKGRKKFKEFRSMIPDILSRIGPEDPVDFQERWEDESKAEEGKEDKKAGSKSTKRDSDKREAIRSQNKVDQDEKGFQIENERITNMSKEGLNALIGARKQVKTSRGKLKLLLEILRLAVNDKDYTSVYDILWVIEGDPSFQEYEKAKYATQGGGARVDQAPTGSSNSDGGSEERYRALVKEVSSMKQGQLQKECEKRGLASKGTKNELLSRLKKILKEESEAPPIPVESVSDDKKKEEKKAKKKEKESSTTGSSNASKPAADPVKSMIEDVDDFIQQARRWREEEPDMVKKQLTDMSHLLPPLSPFTSNFKLDDWQIRVLQMIRNENSVLISAPTSSGKTVLSTHVASMGRKIGGKPKKTSNGSADAEEEIIIEEEDEKEYEEFDDEEDEDDRLLRIMKARESVLFIVPSDPLVWQVAAHFAKWQGLDSDVALITERLTYAPRVASSGRVAASVVIGTPLAIENALTRIRGRYESKQYEHLTAEQQKKLQHNLGEFVGGYDHFKWVVYDEVHSLGNDTPDGMALQRLIKALKCKFLALSATVGNAEELRQWMQQIKGEQITAEAVNAPVVQKETHEGRFINLQRHAWTEVTKGHKKSDGSLATADGELDLIVLHPLSAVSFDFLCDGGFSKSSLPMTPQDSYTLWRRMEETYDANAIEEFNPRSYFKPEDGRITLLKTRLYELKLKEGLEKLARDYPEKTKQLLKSFPMESMKPEFSLYDLVRKLRVKDAVGNDKLPAIVFHLDFAHIVGRFKELLYGLEKSQRELYPDYYSSLEKRRRMLDTEKQRALDSCSTEEEKEELMRESEGSGGQVDTTQPHPEFVLYARSPISRIEYEETLADVTKTDFRGDQQKAESHPLMRALRRGIGLYIDEVTLQAYKRNIMRLATKGKLGVVFSDDSLAFGVNMPFRTCVFCGDMGGRLNTTLVQQMSGRAGRRGLDTQGHLVYAGSDANFVKSMLIAEIPAVKGEDPRYWTLFLQSMLSEHCDRGDFKNQTSIIGQTPLREFKKDVNPLDMKELSRDFLVEMKFIEKCEQLNLSKMEEEEKKEWKEMYSYKKLDTPATRSGYRAVRPINAAVLSMMWILRTRCAESIILGKLLHLLYKDFAENRTKSDAELLDVQCEFIASLLHIVDRRPVIPDGFVMSENQFITNTTVLKRQELRDRIRYINKVVKSFNDKLTTLSAQGKYPNIDKLKAPVDSEDPALDGSLLHCFIEGHTNDIPSWQKHEIKERLYNLGNILKVIHDYLWPDKDKYGRLETISRKCFMRIQYILGAHIKDVLYFENVSAYELEDQKDVRGISANIESSINELLQLEVLGEGGVTTSL